MLWSESQRAHAAIIARYVLMPRWVAEVALRCVMLIGYGARNAGNQKVFWQLNLTPFLFCTLAV